MIWLCLLAIAVALGLRLAALGRKSLWLDEAVTWQVAHADVGEILANRWDRHPPLYYLLMHFWTRLGQGEFALRLPSALLGTAAVPLLYWLVREWREQWSALASAWLLALGPLHIWYSQEARMYALGCTLGLASMLAFTFAIHRKSLAWWAAWIVVTTLGLYTVYPMLLIVLVQAIAFGPVWRARGSRPAALWPALVSLLIVGLLSVPAARAFVKLFLEGGQGWYYYQPARLLLSKWGIAATQSQLQTALLLTGAAVLVAFGVAVWMLSGRLERVLEWKGLVPIAVAGYLLTLLASAILRGLGLKRQLLILLPYGLAIVAVAISRKRYRSLLLAGLAIATLPLSACTVLVQEQEAWREVARLLEEQTQPQDVVLLDAWYAQIPLDYYYRGQAERLGARSGTSPEALQETASSHERVWLVLSYPLTTARTWFDENCTLLHEYPFKGVQVRQYSLP